MFWVRLDALRPLLDAHLGEDEFETEQGQVDGTLAHAIERVFALSAMATDRRLSDAATVCGQSVSSASGDYPYARRNT
jgi:lipopolysaccharide biosynthesis protein